MSLISTAQTSAGEPVASELRPRAPVVRPGRAWIACIVPALVACLAVANVAMAADATATTASPSGSETPPVEPEVAAQGKRKWESYESLMQSHGTLTAYGPDLFGDSVNLANGALSFAVTDVSIPGNSALPVQFRRLYNVRNREFQISDGALADWTIDIPHISGMATPIPPSTTPVWKPGRCLSASPGGVGPAEVVAGGDVVRTDQLWNGLEAHMPGGGKMLHVPGATAPLPGTTSARNGWQWATNARTYFECINNIHAQTSQQGASGEGFVALTADGTRYTFNWLASYRESSIEVAFGSPTILRRKAVLYATRVEDRFGNWVAYNFDSSQTPIEPGRLLSITSSDGRTIQIVRQAGSHFVREVRAGGHSWFYAYQNPDPVIHPGRDTLSQVTLPDGTFWELGFAAFARAEIRYSRGSPQKPPLRNCRSTGESFDPSPITGWVRHPAGAVGTFVVRPETFGRTNVPLLCRDFNASTGDESRASSEYTLIYDAFALHSKAISGPQLTGGTWDYHYHSPSSYFLHPSGGGLPICGSGVDCSPPVCTSASCAGRHVTTIYGPGGKAVRHVFGNSYRYDEGLLLRIEDGESAGPGQPFTARRTTTLDYQLAISGQPYVSRLGTDPQQRGDGYTAEYVRPQRGVRMDQDGASFQWAVEQGSWPLRPGCTSWGVDCFDPFARPTRVRQWSSLASSMNRIERRSYFDDLNGWVLGQRARTALVDPATLVETEVGRTEYDARALPWQEFEFGQLAATMTWHPDGRLWTWRDALNRQTALTDWHRGVPRRIDHPDGTSQQAGVDGFGRITALTDQNGFMTSYQWDALGRPTRIDYPAGDTVAWAPVLFSLTRSWAATHGLAPGHWVWTRSHGNQRVVTYLDALWRPVIEERFDAADPSGTRSQTVKRYDEAGRQSFVSRPQRGLPSAGYGAIVPGTTTEYDALDRVRRTLQDSEYDPPFNRLVTEITWLPGFQQRVTNPRGFATTTSYQAFAVPTTDFPLSIAEPEGVTTTLTRDLYGKPLSMSRTDAQSFSTLTRRFVYDPQQRLCKEVHPESGATIHWYDAVGNRTRTLTGSGLTGLVCDRTSAPWWDATRTDFDAMDRPIVVDVPNSGADTTIGYTPDGLVSSLRTGIHDQPGDWRWSYEYNRRRLLTREHQSLNASELPVTFRWWYDGLGHATHLDANGLWIDYAPNALGQPTRAGGYATNAVWGPDGQLESFVYGNGTVRTVERNARGLPQRIRDVRGGASVIDEQLGWDANGNLGSQFDWLNLAGGSRTHGYDGRDRLTSAWVSGYGTEGFVWDAFDRLQIRTSWAGTETFSYDSTGLHPTHRLVSISGPGGTRSYTHDARGNVTGRPGFTHSFDAVNRLWQSQGSGGQPERYHYDGHGRRTATLRADGSVKVDYYTRDGVLRGSADTGMGSTGGSAVYIHLGETLVAQDAWAWRSPFGMTFFHVDHQGTPLARSDAWGTVFERTRRGSFGLPLVGPLKNGPGYTGHMEDPGTGLVYMQQRYYDPAIARFLSVDPVGPLADPINHFGRYHYGLNNPYRFTDPDGRCPTCPLAAIGAGLGLVAGLGVEGIRQLNAGTLDPSALAVEGIKGAAVGGLTGLTGGLIAGATASIPMKLGMAGTSAFAIGAAGDVAGAIAKGDSATLKSAAVAGAANIVGAAAGAIAKPAATALATTKVPAVKSHPVTSLSGRVFYTVNAPSSTYVDASAAAAIQSATGEAAAASTTVAEEKLRKR